LKRSSGRKEKVVGEEILVKKY